MTDWYDDQFETGDLNGDAELLLDRSSSSSSASSDEESLDVDDAFAPSHLGDAGDAPVPKGAGDAGDAPALELEDIDLFMKHDQSSPPEIPEAPWKQGELLHRQTLILLYNMNKALKNLPLNHRKQIRTLVGAPPAEKVDLAASIIAALTGTSSRTVAKVVAEVEAGTRPIPSSTATARSVLSSTAAASSDSQKPSKEQSMVACTRIALHNICLGRPATEYTGDVRVAQLGGADVGLTHHSRNYPDLAQHFACKIIAQGKERFLQQILPGLGIPSDLEVLADGGTPDHFHGRNKSTVVAAGVVLTCPNLPGTDQAESSTVFLNIASEECDARGEAQAARVTRILEQYFNAGDLRSRFAMACGDGAMAQSSAQHPSTAALNTLSVSLIGSDFVTWDPFHALDNGAGKALCSEGVSEFMDLTKALDYTFTTGQGHIIDKGVASFLQQNWTSSRSPGGTRKVGYITSIPARFVTKFKSFYLALLVRMDLALQGRGRKSMKDLKQLGERLCNIRTLSIGLFLTDLLPKLVEPSVGLVQDVAALPWERYLHFQKVVLAAGQAKETLRRGVFFLQLSLLVSSYLPRADSHRFAFATALTTGSTFFPVFFRYAMPMLWRGELKGCDLLVAAPLTKEQRKVLHPACQCMSRPQNIPGTARIARGGGLISDVPTATIRGANVPVPFWVARSKMTSATAREHVGSPLARVPPRFQDAAEQRTFNRCCCVPSRAPGVLEKLLQAGEEIMLVLTGLETELQRLFVNGGIFSNFQDRGRLLAEAFSIAAISRSPEPGI